MPENRNYPWYIKPPFKKGYFGDFLSWYYKLLGLTFLAQIPVSLILFNTISVDPLFWLYFILANRFKARAMWARRLALLISSLGTVYFAYFTYRDIWFRSQPITKYIMPTGGLFGESVAEAVFNISLIVLRFPIPLILLTWRYVKDEFVEYT